MEFQEQHPHHHLGRLQGQPGQSQYPVVHLQQHPAAAAAPARNKRLPSTATPPSSTAAGSSRAKFIKQSGTENTAAAGLRGQGGGVMMSSSSQQHHATSGTDAAADDSMLLGGRRDAEAVAADIFLSESDDDNAETSDSCDSSEDDEDFCSYDEEVDGSCGNPGPATASSHRAGGSSSVSVSVSRRSGGGSVVGKRIRKASGSSRSRKTSTSSSKARSKRTGPSSVKSASSSSSDPIGSAARARFLSTLDADDLRLKEVVKLLNGERRRLEKIVEACDKLKSETVRKISLQPFDEMLQYRDLLNSYRRECSEMTPTSGQGRKAGDNRSGLSSPGAADAASRSRKKKRADLALKINVLHQNIELSHENVRAKHDLLQHIHDSLVTVSFFSTPAQLRSNRKDEVVINFARDDKFPSGLFIACCMLQDVFQQCMMHDHLILRNGVASSNGVSGGGGGHHLNGSTGMHHAQSPPLHTSPPYPPAAAVTSPPGLGPLAAASPFLPLTQSGQSAATLHRTATVDPISLAAKKPPFSLGPPSSWSEVSKANRPPPPMANQGAAGAGTSSAAAGPAGTAAGTLPRPEKTVAETNRPHCYFDIRILGTRIVRVVIRVRPDKAPFMSENFIKLCTGANKKGVSYKGCRFFRCKPDDHVVCGDFESQNGSGGHSAFDEARLFLAEQCPLKDHKGAVRMRGIERTTEGRCRVGSQFMVWVGDIDYKEYKYTLVFGEVTQGLQYLQEISRIGMMYTSNETWVLRDDVMVVGCGVL